MVSSDGQHVNKVRLCRNINNIIDGVDIRTPINGKDYAGDDDEYNEDDDDDEDACTYTH